MTRLRAWWVTFAIAFVGVTLVQLAWALVVPPFRGIDEHDHAYRASEVADGEWRPDYVRAAHGRGDLITVRRDIVAAAHPVCSWLRYTAHDDCNGVRRVDDKHVLVASAAARYNPAFYWVIGSVAKPWTGAAALYAMRAAAAAMCAAVIACALAVGSRLSRTTWPAIASIVALTPVTTYSTALAAPNGLEMAGALLLWCCLLALPRAVERPTHARLAIAGATAGAVLLATVRSLGPLWLTLILASALVALGRARLQRRGLRAPLLAAGVIVGCAVGAGVAWTVTAGTNNPSLEGGHATESPWPGILAQPVLWLLQSIAAFPTRDEVAPVAVYAIVLVLMWIVLAAAWRTAATRLRLAMLLVTAFVIVIPFVFTLLSFQYVGFAWQGRYTWPVAMGVLLLAGLALDRGRVVPGVTWSGAAVGAAALAMGVATVIGQVHVLRTELIQSPLAHDPAWLRPSATLVVLLTLGGFALIALAGQVGRTPPADLGRVVDEEERATPVNLSR